MKTPIADFIEEYKRRGAMRLHMPGHKGIGGIESSDITEIDGADVLYQPKGIILESERNASLLFGTGKTVYSTEGSSLSIRAMLYLAALYAKSQKKEPFILADRGSHKVLLSAISLLDIPVKWIESEGVFPTIFDTVTPLDIERELKKCVKMPTAVYITSPNYLGNTLDIEKISEVCKRYGALLLVDNAHGAYTAFLTPSRHPIALGADMCADSAHKTLPALTGAAYLHISKSAPRIIHDSVEGAMELFASTSPSYLILKSLDLVNSYIEADYGAKLAKAEDTISALKEKLHAVGYDTVGDEPLKLTLMPKSYGYLGTELAEALWENSITVEFSDPDYTVMMLTPEIKEEELDELYGVLSRIPRKEAITTAPPRLPKPAAVMTPREAMLSPSEEIPIDEAPGRVLASATVACPPAIPIIVSGEVITKEAVDCFRYYGIESCRVVI